MKITQVSEIKKYKGKGQNIEVDIIVGDDDNVIIEIKSSTNLNILYFNSTSDFYNFYSDFMDLRQFIDDLS